MSWEDDLCISSPSNSANEMRIGRLPRLSPTFQIVMIAIPEASFVEVYTAVVGTREEHPKQT